MDYHGLACEIITQAVTDYRDLRKRNLKKEVAHHGEVLYSIKELEEFFNSWWCNFLLEKVGINLNGRELLKNLQSEFTED